jgi:hypothetical protein
MTGGETKIIKDVFAKILGTEVVVKETLDDFAKEEFLELIKNLKKAYALESNAKKNCIGNSPIIYKI